MTGSLSRAQALVLGLVVLSGVAAGGVAFVKIGDRSGLWSEKFELTISLAQASDVDRGTPVRIRGVEAGQVTAVAYPESDADGSKIVVTVKLDAKFRDRVYADAKAAVASKGLLGSPVVHLHPGTPAAGPLIVPAIEGEPAPDLTEVTAKLGKVADRVDAVLKDIQTADGTIPKLLKDDSLYNELKSAVANAGRAAKSLDATAAGVQGELGSVKGMVKSTDAAVTAIRHDAEAIKSLPIIRSYVEDPVKLLVRPDFVPDRLVYETSQIFDDGTTTFSEAGRRKLAEVANWLNTKRVKNSEVVVATLTDPDDKEATPAGSRQMTKKQSEAIAKYFEDQGVHKLGTISRRKVLAVGLGTDPSPVKEKDDLPAGRVEIILFLPRN